MLSRRGLLELFALSLVLFPISGARAVWHKDARRDFSALEKVVKVQTNDEMGGIRGAATVMTGSLLRSLRFKRLHFINASDFESDGEPVEYLISRTGRRVSPLVVFFPGVFNDATSGSSLMIGRQARRDRNHVVLLPNPWGESFQNGRPNFRVGDFDREARAMRDLIRDAIAKIGPGRISSVHFVGESYGGMLAPATAKIMNDEGSFPVATVTSISVPFHIGNAVGVLDRLADRNETPYFDEGCEAKTHGIFRMLGFIYELLTRRSMNEVYSANGVKCSEAIFSYVAFQQPLYHFAERMNRRRPSAKWAAEPESYWRRKLRFRNLGELFYGVPVEDILNSESVTLAYWVAAIRKQGTATMALVAKNDPLNPPPGVGIYKVVDSYPPDDILVLPNGGHLGFRGERAYRRLIRDQLDFSKADDLEAGADEELDNDPSPADDGYTDEIEDA